MLPTAARPSRLRLRLLRLVPLLCAGTAVAAQDGARVVVRDSSGVPVPFAYVRLASGVARTADDSGRVRFGLTDRDSMRLQVRRIGYHEFYGWVRRARGEYAVTLAPVTQRLEAVNVEERANTPLARTGFYDRMDRVQNGAITGEFITPEELDMRNVMSVTRMFEGRRSVRVERKLVLGRTGCGVTFIVDGVRVRTVEEQISGLTSLFNASGGRGYERIDDIVSGQAVMAIEIYGSAANAPAELITLGGRGSCAIVAIWTGGRQ